MASTPPDRNLDYTSGASGRGSVPHFHQHRRSGAPYTTPNSASATAPSAHYYASGSGGPRGTRSTQGSASAHRPQLAGTYAGAVSPPGSMERPPSAPTHPHPHALQHQHAKKTARTPSQTSTPYASPFYNAIPPTDEQQQQQQQGTPHRTPTAPLSPGESARRANQQQQQQQQQQPPPRSVAEIAEALQAAIEDSLDAYLFENAIFYAERLAELRPESHRCLHTLADCYARSGDLGSAYRLLETYYPFFNTADGGAAAAAAPPRGSGSLRSLARQPAHQPLRPATAEIVVRPLSRAPSTAAAGATAVPTSTAAKPAVAHTPSTSMSASTPSLPLSVMMAAAWDCHYLFGVCCCRTQRHEEGRRVMEDLLALSTRHFVREPLPQPATVTPEGVEAATTTAAAAAGGGNDNDGDDADIDDGEDEDGFAVSQRQLGEIQYWLGLAMKHELSSSASGDILHRAVQHNPLLFCAFEEYLGTAAKPSEECLSAYGGLPRRADRTSAFAKRLRLEGGGGAHGSSNDSGVPVLSRAARRSLASQRRQRQQTLQLYLQPFARALFLNRTFRCGEAVQVLTAFPSVYDHSDARQAAAPLAPTAASPWRLTELALAHFHKGSMQEASDAFRQSLELAPWRLNQQALVYYSTALWQLRADGALGVLAQTMREELPDSAATCAVVANAYSLAREPKEALVMLERASRLDPFFAYPYTLKGYELLALDQKAEASAAFKQAIKVSRTHYMAYAGLGELHLREEQLDYARQYFGLAISVNPLPTVMNRYAASFHRRDATPAELEEAVRIYDACARLHPGNLSAKHQRADALLRLGRPREAIQALEALIKSAPEEAALYMTLARCMETVGELERAVRLYHHAMHLDPRRTGFIRSCMERLSAAQEAQ